MTLKNEEFVALLKSVINENKLSTIPGDDLIEIYKQASSIDASSNSLDIELSKAIDTLLEEIKKRGLNQDIKPQETPHCEYSSVAAKVNTSSSKIVGIAMIVGVVIFILIIGIVTGRLFNIILGGIVFAWVYGVYNFFKGRFQPKDTKPQEIPNYEDYSFKQNEADGRSKWVYAIAISAIIIALVLIISNYSLDKTGTEAPKAPTFRLQDYYNAYKDYYGDVPLETVAKDVYQREYQDKYPDYENWKKAKGIDQIIQEDNDRRKPSFSNKVMGAIPFRYDEESIHGRLYRYDRFTKTVEERQGIDENTFKWVPRPRYKNLQHVRDFMAQWERNRQIWAIDEQNTELRRKQNLQQEELKRKLEDIKDTLEAERRDQQTREMNRQFEEREREIRRQR